MEVTLIGIIAVAVGGLGFVKSDRTMILTVMAFIPIEVAAAMNLPGGMSVLCAQILLIMALARSVLSSYTTHGRFVAPQLPTSGYFLLALCVYGFISSFFFPRLMHGVTEVFTLSRSVAITRLVPLAPSGGNISQSAYLFAGALLFLLVYFAVKKTPRLGFTMVAVMAASCGVAAFLDIASVYVPLSALWDQVRTANYAIMPSQMVVGIKRVIGGTPEPSSFSTQAVGFFAFYASLFLSGSQQRHFLAAAGFFLLTMMALASTGFSALAAVAVALGAGSVVRFVVRGVGRPVLIVALVAVPVVAGVGILLINTPAAMDLIDRILQQLVFGKLETSSGEERLTWTLQALRNFTDTWGLGIGLGSNRSNGLATALLSQVGAPGTILFLAFMATSFLRPLTSKNAPTDDPAAALFRASRTAAFAIFVAGMTSATRVDLGAMWFTFAGVAVAAHELARERMHLGRAGARRPSGPPLASGGGLEGPIAPGETA